MSAFTPKYKFRDGCHINKKYDAQVIGEMCNELASTVGLTPRTLLDANRDEYTPLYDYFEWDDEVAAEKYREEQARYVIRSIIIVSEEPDVPEVKAFNSVVVYDKPQFEHIDTIVKSVDLTAQMLEKAKRELFAFQVKYNTLRNYAELSEVFDSIDNLRNSS